MAASACRNWRDTPVRSLGTSPNGRDMRRACAIADLLFVSATAFGIDLRAILETMTSKTAFATIPGTFKRKDVPTCSQAAAAGSADQVLAGTAGV
jgi:hypothetical protein